MAFELQMQMLGLVTFLLMLGWVPEFVCKCQSYGLGWMLSNRSTAGLPPLPEWGQRAERAYDNLQAHYPAFAVAALLLALTGGFSLRTSLAAAVFAAARLVHMPAYVLGSVWLWVLSWALGFAAGLNLLVTAVLGLVKIWTFPLYLFELHGKTALRSHHKSLREMIFWHSGFSPPTATMS